MYAIGTPVSYRLWAHEPWQQGTIVEHEMGADKYVAIKRDGYRETTIMSVAKLAGGAGSAFVTPHARHFTEVTVDDALAALGTWNYAEEES